MSKYVVFEASNVSNWVVGEPLAKPDVSNWVVDNLGTCHQTVDN